MESQISIKIGEDEVKGRAPEASYTQAKNNEAL